MDAGWLRSLVRARTVGPFVLATAITAAALAGPLATAPVAAGSSAWFRSPSGNIGCYMTATYVRCDVIEHGYTPPPKPASCDFGWGPALEVRLTGKGRFGCVSDTVAGATRVLAYGRSIAIGPFRCTSRSTGMTCTNTADRHGFTLSRAAYRLF